MTKQNHTVHYEGWVVVLADDDTEAVELANDLISNANLPYDGISGEWELSDVEISDEDF